MVVPALAGVDRVVGRCVAAPAVAPRVGVAVRVLAPRVGVTVRVVAPLARSEGRAVGRVVAPEDAREDAPVVGRTDADRVALSAPLEGPVLDRTGLAPRAVDAAVVGRALADPGIRACCEGLATAERGWAVRVVEYPGLSLYSVLARYTGGKLALTDRGYPEFP